MALPCTYVIHSTVPPPGQKGVPQSLWGAGRDESLITDYLYNHKISPSLLFQEIWRAKRSFRTAQRPSSIHRVWHLIKGSVCKICSDPAVLYFPRCCIYLHSILPLWGGYGCPLPSHPSWKTLLNPCFTQGCLHRAVSTSPGWIKTEAGLLAA